MSKPTSATQASPLMVRLDTVGKALLAEAARLRRVSISDYVRTVTVSQAAREVEAAKAQTLAMTPDEQLAFWQALSEPPVLTASQRKLGDLMRGKR